MRTDRVDNRPHRRRILKISTRCRFGQEQVVLHQRAQHMRVGFRETEMYCDPGHEPRTRATVIGSLALTDVMEERGYEEQVRSVHVTTLSDFSTR